MKQEERQLLLKDLSARLPHDVKIEITWWVMGEGTCMNTTLEPDHIEQLFNDEYGDTEIKPYLRPMSSMTDEENEEFKSIAGGKMIEGYNFIVRKCTLEYKTIAEIEEWLNTNNFDFRGLIEKDLALEAPEGMYKID